MIVAMNRMVIIGTPRTNSMMPTHRLLMAMKRDRRPSASRMPNGTESTTPITASSSVSISPPHLVVSTGSSPRPPPSSQ